MTILARTGKARWCSVCGRSWLFHLWRPIVNYKTGQKSARCLRAEWTTRGRAKRERRRRKLIESCRASERWADENGSTYREGRP